MAENLHLGEKQDQRRYWHFWLPITVLFALMIKFPLRINQRESLLDTLFYGSIVIECLITAVRVYKRFGKRGHRLIAVILLCAMLSGWQIFDLDILRLEGPSAYAFSATSGIFEPLHDGWAWYNLRFPNPNIMCNALFEQYFGNNFIAITYEINRDATWFACGG